MSDNLTEKDIFNINKKTSEKNYIGHRKRVKNKIEKFGISKMDNYEILEALLFYSITRKDTKYIAKTLITRFKNIETILHTSKENLMSVKGVTENTYIYLKLLGELNGHLYKNMIPNKFTLNSVEKVYDYLKSSIGHYETEVFKVLFLSSNNNFLGEEILFHGTIDKSQIYPREIIKKILKYNAKSVIFSHNHPSGNSKPSQADISLTNKLKTVLAPLEITVLDHIIITPEKYYSFLEEGLI